MAYYTGDIPSEDVVIEPARNGEAIDLTAFNDVDVELYSPDGELVPSAGFIGEIDGETVVIEWPGDSVFDAPGVFDVRVVLLHTVTGVRETIAPLRYVVQAADGWHTVDSIREELNLDGEDVELQKLLDIAKQAVVAYAPPLEEDQRPPTNYVQAQAMQARNVWNSANVDTSGDIGDGTYALRPHPLDWQIKQILRPKTVMGIV